MKKEFLSYAKVVLSSMIAATVIITVRYCLYAPEQIGQLARLFA